MRFLAILPQAFSHPSLSHFNWGKQVVNAINGHSLASGAFDWGDVSVWWRPEPRDIEFVFCFQFDHTRKAVRLYLRVVVMVSAASPAMGRAIDFAATCAVSIGVK